MRAPTFVSFSLVLLAACSSDPSSSPDASGDDVDAAVDGPASACPRTPKAADRTRHIVVAKPYDTAGAKANVFEVIEVSATGQLTRPNRTFTMGRGAFGSIAFTPDGKVGMLAQEGGTLGVFTIDDAGEVTVVHAALEGEVYASRVYADPDGEHAWILDTNWREHGGALYRATIGCDGALSDIMMVAPSRLPSGVAFFEGRMLVAAADIGDSMTAGHDVHLFDRAMPPALVAGADAFGDDLQIVAGSALSADGATYFIGDASAGGNNRVAIVGVTPTGMTPLARLPLDDPQGIATSPFGDVAIVTTAIGDAITILDKQGAGATWRIRGPVSTPSKPLLPGDVASVHAGMLRGRVFVSENVSIRQLAFREDGTVENIGSLAFGSGLENILGAIGITP
jgi:hypothetical protein